MGLRCLIGHEYGEPETSRDRNQRGNEVVVTVREYRECTRCGHRRIISENKEVTTEAAGDEPEEPSAEASWSEAPESEDQATVDSFARSSSAGGSAPDESMTAAEDDGIILEDEPEEAPERGHGEWPAADVGTDEAADASADPEPWPDEAAQPEEPEPPEPPEPDGEPLDAGPEPTGESADATESVDDEPEPEAPPATDNSAAAEPEPAPTPRPDNRNTEFVCPDCGETWPSRNASLRPGDICPECRQGYLDERVVQ